MANQPTSGGQRRQMTQRDRLNQNIAERSRFDWSNHDGKLHGVCRELIEQIVFAAAANDVKYLDLPTDELLDLPERSPIEQGEAFQCAADRRAGRLRHGLPILA